MIPEYKQKNNYAKRRTESSRILAKYMSHIPVICEKTKTTKVTIDKNKFLVPRDFTVGQFMYIIRKRINVGPEKAIFLFIGNVIPNSSALVSDLYQDQKDEDGFLYCSYSTENTFG